MQKRIPDEIVDRVRQANDIVDVIGEFVQLHRQGRNFFGLCPFHDEKTPSFSVTPDKQIFYCFGCKKGGNVITFLMELENYSRSEEHTSELQSRGHLVCRLLLEKKKSTTY